MNNKSVNIIILILLAITLGYIIYIYPSLPDLIPTHWGTSGEADRYNDKSYVFLFFAIIVGINVLMPVVAKIDPRKDNYLRFGKSFNIFRIAITLLFMGVTFISTQAALSNLSDSFSVDKLVPALIGVLFIVIGNYMPKFKHNYTMGIKTPWTLADEDVWNKTHRVSGPIWIIGGALMILNGFLVPDSFTIYVIITTISIMVILPFAYSYVIYRKKHKE